MKNAHWERHTNPDLCREGKVDAWKYIIIKDLGGDDIIVYEYIGQEVMKNVDEKTYFVNMLVRNSVKACALEYPASQNSQLEKTKGIVFDKLETCEFLLIIEAHH